MKFFMSIYFKLLYVDNHSKDLLAEINFLVWRPYIKLLSIQQLSSLGVLSSQYMQTKSTKNYTKIIQKLLTDTWSYTLTIGCNFMFQDEQIRSWRFFTVARSDSGTGPLLLFPCSAEKVETL